jgi:hypothetical protein
MTTGRSHLLRNRIYRILYVPVLIIYGFTTAFGAQELSSRIQGPVLGFAGDRATETIWPILGVPGASILGHPLQLEVDIRNAVISARQNLAIAVRREDGQSILIRLDTNWLEITELAGVSAAPDSVAVSPLGTAAAFFNQSSGIVQVVRGLPENPEIFHEFDARVISGSASQMAISDDGSCVLMIFEDGDESALWILNSAGALWRFGAVHPSSIQFLAKRHDAIVADTAGHEIFVLKDLGETAIPIPLTSFDEEFGSLPLIAASEDGLIVVMTQAKSGRTTVIDVQTGTQTILQCQCEQGGLFRLRENALFQLNDVSERPLVLLDASSTEPRIILIPSDPVLLNSNPPNGEEQ